MMGSGALEAELVRPAAGRTGLPTVGIVGGGQLGRMMALAGHALGLRLVVLDPDPASPASQVVPVSLEGAFDDIESLRSLARITDIVTFENEWVEPLLVAQLEADGCRVWPASRTLARIQDKLHQRTHLAAAGLPVPRFAAAPSLEAVRAWGGSRPLVLKTRLQGYDGHGVRIVENPAHLEDAWEALAGQPLMVEAFVTFERELAVMVARSSTGEVRSYPVVETRQRRHVCHTVIAPAPVDEVIRERAGAVARAAVEAVEGVGIFGVELFVDARGEVSINELAPRPHNSGHYTLDACTTSQFEQHLRAVLGWPLADPSMHSPAAVMVNILAEGDAPEAEPDLAAALAFAGVKVHWYGKRGARPGRKLGHITAVARDPAVAYERALAAREALGI